MSTKHTIRPLADRLLVDRLPYETQSLGGIILPENAQERPARGKVVAVGSDVKDIQVGDEILFGKYSGVETEAEGETYLIMREEDVLGVVE